MSSANRSAICWAAIIAGECPLSTRLAGHKPAMVAQISRELAEQGFHTHTLAASGKPDEDLKNVTCHSRDGWRSRRSAIRTD